MERSECLVIVQRHQHALYSKLQRTYRGSAEVVFDRRLGERRRGGPYEGADRRRQDRRRPLESAQRAAWTDLRHLQVVRTGGVAVFSGSPPSRDSLSA